MVDDSASGCIESSEDGKLLSDAERGGEEDTSEALLSAPGGNTAETGRFESETKVLSCCETFATFEKGGWV